MGNKHSSHCEAFVHSAQAILRQRDLKISEGTLKKVLQDIDRTAPWFLVSGDLNVPSWDKLGKDLVRAREEGTLKAGTFPFWKLMRSCLKDDQNVEALKAGRRALTAYQDSLSGTDSKDDEEKGEQRKKKKGGKQTQKDKSKEKRDVDTPRVEPSAPLYPLLDEFALI